MKKKNKIPNSLSYDFGGFIAPSINLMQSLGEKYNETNLGQSTIGKIGAFALSPFFGASNLFANKKRKEAERKQARLQEEQRQQISNQNMSVVNSLMTPSNQSNLPMAMGGNIEYKNGGGMNPIGSFTEFNNGGSHEFNPLGGIPQGYNSEGQLRLVEEGESSYKFKDGKYIFSNRLTIQ